MGVYIKNTTKEELIEWVKLVWPHGDYDEHTFDNVINIETPHGRLIDTDVLARKIVESNYGVDFINKTTALIIDTPIVMEAEE